MNMIQSIKIPVTDGNVEHTTREREICKEPTVWAKLLE